tara:strand:- start:185 stop:511 length:327 start_codon:yes stop_codon:yes gene_type:complete
MLKFMLMKNFFSFFFSLILLLPPVYNLVHHLVEEHKHCDVTEVHFHQLENKCEFCALLNTNSSEEELFNSAKDFILIDHNFELVRKNYDFKFANNSNPFATRGPPSNS